MPPKTRGRPRKIDVVNPSTNEKVLEKQRKYQREYKSRTGKQIMEVINELDRLDQMEKDCVMKLEQVRKDKKQLLDIAEQANNQAGALLKESNKPLVKKKTVKRMLTY